MKRREFVKKTVTGAAAGGLLAGCSKSAEGPSVQTQPRVRWRLASSFPRALDTIFGAADVLSERVSELTDGRFTIRVHPAGEIVPGLQVLDAVQQANVEIGHSAGYYYIGKNPALAFDTAMPFGLNARQQSAWLSESGGGLQLMREVYSDFNIINFPGGNTGVQMGGWFRREINSMTDLKGLKMRIPGLGGEIMNRLGVTVQVLAGGDIYPALERGAIDATEWVGPYDDQKLGFHQVAKNYYYPGWWEPGPGLSFFINRGAWDKLPSAYQAALETAAAEASQGMLIEYDARNPAALQELLSQGINLRPFPKDMLVAAQKEMAGKMAEMVSADAGFKKIYDPWNKFRTESSKWLATGELTYGNFAFKG